MKIFNQKNGKLTDADRLQLATLLLKAGYPARIYKEIQNGKAVQVIEAIEE